MENEAVLMKLCKEGSYNDINDAQVEYWCGSATGFEADGCPNDRSANKLVAPGIFAQIRVWTRANKVNNLGLITQTCRNTVNTGYFRQLSHDFQLQRARARDVSILNVSAWELHAFIASRATNMQAKFIKIASVICLIDDFIFKYVIRNTKYNSR